MTKEICEKGAIVTLMPGTRRPSTMRCSDLGQRRGATIADASTSTSCKEGWAAPRPPTNTPLLHLVDPTSLAAIVRERTCGVSVQGRRTLRTLLSHIKPRSLFFRKAARQAMVTEKVGAKLMVMALAMDGRRGWTSWTGLRPPHVRKETGLLRPEQRVQLLQAFGAASRK